MPKGFLGQQPGKQAHVESMPKMRVNPKTGKLEYPKRTKDERERQAVRRERTGFVPAKTVADTVSKDGRKVATVNQPQARILTTGKVIWQRGQWTILHHERARRYDPLVGCYTGEWDANVIEIVKGDPRDHFRGTGKQKRWRMIDGRLNGTGVPVTVEEAARLLSYGLINGSK